MSDGFDLPDRVNEIASVRIRLASPEDIRGWSHGEVTQHDFLKEPLETPHPAGLFSEPIFGPLNDWCCGCRVKGKARYWGREHRGFVCPQCHVRIDEDNVRRQRLGHVELALPVVHTWFLRARPSPLAQLLGLPADLLLEIASYQTYIVLHPGDTGLAERSTLSEMDYLQWRGKGKKLEAETGGRAIKLLLQTLNLAKREKEVRKVLDPLVAARKYAPRQRELARILEVLGWIGQSENRPEWLVLDCLPVLPADLRPMRQMPGRDARISSDLNVFYQNILRINEKLRRSLELKAPRVILRDQGKQLQRAVDCLFDNARCDPPLTGLSRRPLRSLTELLQGKDGRFRQNLLGKRVDYSGRAVIVVGPKLRLDQCGLPRRIAETLFRPHLLGRLTRLLFASFDIPWNVALRSAHALLGRNEAEGRRVLRQVVPAHRLPEVDRILTAYEHLHETWLREILERNVVLLNRAPSLHRMNIQAFRPVLHEGKTILLHPLVCEGFGADFDGDTMAVHLPLSDRAQEEARALMRPECNLLTPASGRPLVPSNEIVLGCSYLTSERQEARGKRQEGWVTSAAEVVLAHSLGKAGLHDRVTIRFQNPREVVGLDESGNPRTFSSRRRHETTVGRVLFDEVLPPGMPFYDLPLTRRSLGSILTACFRLHGARAMAELLDRIKDLGFQVVTRSGLSFIVEDLLEPANREECLSEARKNIVQVRLFHEAGLFDDDWRYRQTIRLWQEAQDRITRQLQQQMRDDRRIENGKEVAYLNPLYLMAQSGARGNWSQMRQLAALRGLMARPSGKRSTIEQSITSSLRQGLSVLEYWVSTHGARKAGADKDALPDSGYLTRRLVDVAHHVVVTNLDCGTTEGRLVAVRSAQGRVCLDEVRDAAGTIHLLPGDLIARGAVKRMRQAGVRELRVRGPFTCRAARGVCQLCYGSDPSTERLIGRGAAVGVRAAQSIGEPGTQLAMRTKHTGGVVMDQDMVSGLDRITALFEAREPKRPAVLAEADGVIEAILLGATERQILVRPVERPGSPWVHGPLAAGCALRVRVGDRVRRGEALTAGDPRADDLLRLRGVEAVREWFLEECQRVYRANGVTIDDRHFEIVLAQALARWRIDHAGDTGLLPGAIVERPQLEEANQNLGGRVRIKDPGSTSHVRGDLIDEKDFLTLQGREQRPPSAVSPRPARATPLGITRAAMEVESFLSAASFQQTSQVLMEAALAGRVDPLCGLKENLLLGRLIPAGTGFLPNAECGTRNAE